MKLKLIICVSLSCNYKKHFVYYDLNDTQMWLAETWLWDGQYVFMQNNTLGYVSAEIILIYVYA